MKKQSIIAPNVTPEKIKTVVPHVKANIFYFLIIYYVYLVITLNLAKSVAKETAMQTIISILEMFFVKKVDAKKGFTI